ncbi:MAG: CpaF family protein [Vampirovibrionales bacterium]|nr:CpaF family protein [Vampirovibrionales bacterium]
MALSKTQWDKLTGLLGQSASADAQSESKTPATPDAKTSSEAANTERPDSDSFCPDGLSEGLSDVPRKPETLEAVAGAFAALPEPPRFDHTDLAEPLLAANGVMTQNPAEQRFSRFNDASTLASKPAHQVRSQTDAEELAKRQELDARAHKTAELKSNIHKRLIDEVDLTPILKSSGGEKKSDAQIRAQIKQVIVQLLAEEETLLTSAERDQVIEDILDETLGLGPLEPLLKDPTVNDILINGPKRVFVERKGKLEQTAVTFKDNAHLLQIIDRIVSAVGRRVDETQPLCDARLADGSRFNCVIPPLALDGPLVSIRKFSKDPYKVHDLVKFGTLSEAAANLLNGFVQARLNIVISGGTGSGKTTLLNVLSSFIPHDERIVTIEDAAELQLQQPHVARMETRPSNIEGKGEISQRELVKNSLRMRPERIVLGECRGGESLDMLQAMNTGHDGSLTTLHANTPRDAIRRLETMVMMAGYDLPARAIREQIASAVNVIIQASRLSDGSRRVMNITEVVGMEGDVVLLQDIFVFRQTGVDENRKVIGSFEYTGIRPKFLDTMLSAGVDVDLGLFQ